jgi:hypothetical protein
MTKLSNDADYRVSVRPMPWDVPGPESKYFAGIYTVSLNSHVEISFVPDVSNECPPWSADLVPNGDDVASEREARVYQVLMSLYSVTPNARLAGTEEPIELETGSSPPDQGAVWYLAPDDWQTLMDELENLTETAYSEVHFVRFSQIADTRLARFLESRFLPSGRLSRRHLEILHRA